MKHLVERYLPHGWKRAHRVLLAVSACGAMAVPGTAAEPVSATSQTSVETTRAAQPAPVLMVKTNALYDVLGAPNLALELPIGQHHSVAVKYLFPWWKNSSDSWAAQILDGSAEYRYWPGGNPRYSEQRLTWFVGALVGGGDYDWERHSKGYQGEFVKFGVDAGLIAPMSRHFRWEFSIGAGAMLTKYRRYEGMADNRYLVWKRNGHCRWYGPLEANVGVVYLLPMSKKGGDR